MSGMRAHRAVLQTAIKVSEGEALLEPSLTGPWDKPDGGVKEVGTMQHTTTFWECLFDFSFTKLVTTKIVKVLYGLAIAGVVIWTFVFVKMMFDLSSGAGVAALLIGGPLLFLVGVIAARVILETTIVLFRMAEHVGEIARQVRHVDR